MGIVLCFVLAVLLMFSPLSHAEKDIEHSDMSDYWEHTKINSETSNENSLEYYLVCPVCDKGEIIRNSRGATCTQSGFNEMYCTYCDYYSKTYQPPKPHNFADPSAYYCYEQVRCRDCGGGQGGRGARHRSYYWSRKLSREE